MSYSENGDMKEHTEMEKNEDESTKDEREGGNLCIKIIKGEN